MTTNITLKTVVFLGSARNIVAPWGGDSRLGDRVANWVKSTLSSRSEPLGDDQKVVHEVRVVDPLDVFGPDGALSHSGGEMKAPVFFMNPASLQPAVKQLQDAIKGADCYLIVSPEYNHSIPPALGSVMGHFGGSNYKVRRVRLC